MHGGLTIITACSASFNPFLQSTKKTMNNLLQKYSAVIQIG
jgi:hypothetical protein